MERPALSLGNLDLRRTETPLRIWLAAAAETVLTQEGNPCKSQTLDTHLEPPTATPEQTLEKSLPTS